MTSSFYKPSPSPSSEPSLYLPLESFHWEGNTLGLAKLEKAVTSKFWNHYSVSSKTTSSTVFYCGLSKDGVLLWFNSYSLGKIIVRIKNPGLEVYCSNFLLTFPLWITKDKNRFAQFLITFSSWDWFIIKSHDQKVSQNKPISTHKFKLLTKERNKRLPDRGFLYGLWKNRETPSSVFNIKDICGWDQYCL